MRRKATSLLLLLGIWIAPPAFAEDIAVIANNERASMLGRVGRDEIAQIYMKKRRFWDDGSSIVPVNRDAGAATRSGFDSAVFGPTARRLPMYWNREYFRGVLPPATLASDEAVRRFIASEPRAIGYVRASAVDDSIAVVVILKDALP